MDLGNSRYRSHCRDSSLFLFLIINKRLVRRQQLTQQ